MQFHWPFPRQIAWVGLTLDFDRFLVRGYTLIHCPSGRKTKIAFSTLLLIAIAIRENNWNIDFTQALSRAFSFLSCFPSFKDKMFLAIQIMRPENWFQRLKKRILDFGLSQGAAALEILLRSRTSSCVQDSGAPNDSFLPHSLKTLFRLTRVFLDL